MNRWHSERQLMLRRWRMELAEHDGRPLYSLAPVNLSETTNCDCANGIGTMRKHRAYGCEILHCFCKDIKRHRTADRKGAAAKWKRYEESPTTEP